MMRRLPTLVRRLVAVALLALPLLAVYHFAVSPVMARLADLDARIEQERRLAGRLAEPDTKIAPDAGHKAAAAQARGLFIEGASEAIRAAALQSNLSTLAGHHGLKIRTSRSLPARERPGLRLIGAQFQVVAPLDKLQALIVDMERHKPALVITALHVNAAGAPRMPGQESPGLLDARFDVFAVEARNP